MAAVIASPQVTPTDRFGLTLFVATMLHGLIILGVSFSLQFGKGDAIRNALDVVLVNTVSQEAPKDAKRIAQFNQQQSGSAEADGRPAEMLSSPMPSVAEGEAPVPNEERHQRPREVREQQTLDATRSKVQVQPQTKTEREHRSDRLTPEEISRRDIEIARLAAEVDLASQRYAKRPKIHFIDALSAKSAVEARYIDYWVKRVESIGNLNYPEDARREGISGKLILNVLLDNTGAVLKVHVALSSGSRVLDEAAISIVKMSSPFPPFPKEMRAQYDQLMVTRTWVFRSDGV